MRTLLTLILLIGLLALPGAPTRSYTLQYTSTGASVQVRWPTTTIQIALSNSLGAPPSNIEAAPADVLLAARRALKTWSDASNIQFVVTTSAAESLNPADGVNLITVSQINAAQFSSPNQQGRARIRFTTDGQIVEGDIGVNPNVRFSTDGRAGTFDLESTFVHEIGHLLGLEHSGLVGASMQPRQALNGTLDLPAITVRTLSDDDRAGIRAIYGPRTGTGSLAGAITYLNGAPAFGASVWAESVTTGKVIGNNIALPNGAYRIDGLPPDSYRVVVEYLNEPVNAGEIASRSGAYQGLSTSTTVPFLTAEGGTVGVSEGVTSFLSLFVQGSQVLLNPTFIGTGNSGQLSTAPVPLVPGRTTNVLVGGSDVRSALPAGVAVNSPFMRVSNIQDLGLGFGIPVISFDVTVDIAAPPGEYSVRLQNGSEAAYIAGGLVIDLPGGVTTGNLIDDAFFFVAQHYRDFLNREPDAAGLQFWANQISSCGADAACLTDRRVNVSAAFFLSIEFQQTGYFVYRVHYAAFATGERLRLRDFLFDTQRIGRGVVVGAPGWEQQLESNRQALLDEFVQRPAFLARYPASLTPEQFVDALNQNAGGVLSPTERDALVAELRGGTRTRAQVLRAVAEDADLRAREFNKAFVLMQYFGYLRRNPDDPPDTDFTGYNFWLQKLNEHNGDFVQSEMVKSFLLAAEYRARFGRP
jgi:hypothetical protein